MDRNTFINYTIDNESVALRKESVDRNTSPKSCRPTITASLSARRAWIEMEEDGILSTGAPVALRKESVDRNDLGFGIAGHGKGSLSARRAWIEIRALFCRSSFPPCRSPQGERG